MWIAGCKDCDGADKQIKKTWHDWTICSATDGLYFLSIYGGILRSLFNFSIRQLTEVLGDHYSVFQNTFILSSMCLGHVHEEGFQLKGRIPAKTAQQFKANAHPTQLFLYPELKCMSKTSTVSLFIHVWSVGGGKRWKHLRALWKLLICNAACSKGAKHGESICSSGADSFGVTVVTSGPSRGQGWSNGPCSFFISPTRRWAIACGEFDIQL